MKKSLSLILSLVMIITTLAVLPFSASALPKIGTLGTEGTTYLFESGTVDINGKGTTMHNYTNTGEDVSPFKNSTEIKKAFIMNTPNIGSFLFIGCSNLTTVEIVNDTTTIGDNAFFNCTSLETVDFHNKDVLTTVKEQAFSGCTGLKEFKFPKSLTILGNYAFEGCSNLERVIIPNPNCYIGGNAFINCAKLKGFTYPEITSPTKAIFAGVFYGCSAMKKVSLPGNIAYVDYSAFEGCTALTDVYFEGTQEKWNAIYWQPNNDAAKNATLHCNCEWGYCGDNAEYVYNNVDKTLTISGTGKTDNYNNDLGAGAPWYSYKDDIESVVIKEGITGIGHYNFADESNLKSITVPKSLQNFGNSAFNNTTSITEVNYAGAQSEWEASPLSSYGTFNTATVNYNTSPEPEPEPTFDVTYDFNGGTKDGKGTYVTKQVAFAPDITANFIDAMGVTAPAGKVLDAIEINGVRYELGSSYLLNKNTTYKYIWKDIAPVVTATPKATLSATSYTYNGKVRTPSVTVKAGNTVLKKGTDYTVSFAKGRKNVGTYKVTVTYKGKYSGTKTLTFKINPKGTSVSKVTSPKKKQLKVIWKKQATQTTGYQIQYSTSSKFTKKTTKTVTVSKNKTMSKTISKLTSKKKYYVRIRTYKTVGKTKYYSAWSKAKNVKVK